MAGSSPALRSFQAAYVSLRISASPRPATIAEPVQEPVAISIKESQWVGFRRKSLRQSISGLLAPELSRLLARTNHDAGPADDATTHASIALAILLLVPSAPYTRRRTPSDGHGASADARPHAHEPLARLPAAAASAPAAPGFPIAIQVPQSISIQVATTTDVIRGRLPCSAGHTARAGTRARSIHDARCARTEHDARRTGAKHDARPGSVHDA